MFPRAARRSTADAAARTPRLVRCSRPRTVCCAERQRRHFEAKTASCGSREDEARGWRDFGNTKTKRAARRDPRAVLSDRSLSPARFARVLAVLERAPGSWGPKHTHTHAPPISSVFRRIRDGCSRGAVKERDRFMRRVSALHENDASGRRAPVLGDRRQVLRVPRSLAPRPLVAHALLLRRDRLDRVPVGPGRQTRRVSFSLPTEFATLFL